MKNTEKLIKNEYEKINAASVDVPVLNEEKIMEMAKIYLSYSRQVQLTESELNKLESKLLIREFKNIYRFICGTNYSDAQNNETNET